LSSIKVPKIEIAAIKRTDRTKDLMVPETEAKCSRSGMTKDDNSVEKLMLDLVYGGHAGWAAAEFNLVEAGLIEMIQGHQPCLMREGDNAWMDLRWTLTDLGRRTRKARFELVMKSDPPLWAAEQDAEEEAQDYQQNFADGDPDDYWTAIHRHMSIRLDKRAERIRQKMRRRAGAHVNEPR
jgi:hypothetical protein